MWPTISSFINLVLGALSIYLYFENRYLKGLEVDKNLREKLILLEQVKARHITEKNEFDAKENEAGRFGSGIYQNNLKTLQHKQVGEADLLNNDIDHLVKLKKYRWLLMK